MRTLPMVLLFFCLLAGGFFLFANPGYSLATEHETKSITLEFPSNGDNFLLFKAPHDIEMVSIDCIVDPSDSSESVVIDIEERDASGDNPSSVDTSITCDNDGASDDGTFSNANIDEGDWISLDIGTVTGTVDQVSVTLHYGNDIL